MKYISILYKKKIVRNKKNKIIKWIFLKKKVVFVFVYMIWIKYDVYSCLYVFL